MKIRPLGAELLFHAEGQTDRHDEVKFLFIFTKALNKELINVIFKTLIIQTVMPLCTYSKKDNNNNNINADVCRCISETDCTRDMHVV